MRTLVLILILAVASPAAAFDLGIHGAAKPPASHEPPPVDIEVTELGGDHVDDPFVLDRFSAMITGSTVGYTDDYDEACPHAGGGSPDVVYDFRAPTNMVLDIDLAGSAFDTKVYIYRENLKLVACNDDYHGEHTSRLERVVLVEGARYYLVIDGHGGAAGEYTLSISQHDPCHINAPQGVELEGEPPLADGYVDTHNGGCNSVEHGKPVQSIEAWLFHGKSGWYVDTDGVPSRDTDWFAVEMPASGQLEIWGAAEQPTWLAELGPRRCGGVQVLQRVLIEACTEQALTVTGEPGSTIWLWVAPMRFESPHYVEHEYSYVLTHEDFLAPMSAKSADWIRIRELFH